MALKLLEAMPVRLDRDKTILASAMLLTVVLFLLVAMQWERQWIAYVWDQWQFRLLLRRVQKRLDEQASSSTATISAPPDTVATGASSSQSQQEAL